MRKDISGYVKAWKTYAAKKDDRHKKYGTTVRVQVAELPCQKVHLNFCMDLPVKSRIINPKNTGSPLRNAAHGDKREDRARNAVELRRSVEISREWANEVEQINQLKK